MDPAPRFAAAQVENAVGENGSSLNTVCAPHGDPYLALRSIARLSAPPPGFATYIHSAGGIRQADFHRKITQVAENQRWTAMLLDMATLSHSKNAGMSFHLELVTSTSRSSSSRNWITFGFANIKGIGAGLFVLLNQQVSKNCFFAFVGAELNP
jgi:hypothetical protein